MPFYNRPPAYEACCRASGMDEVQQIVSGQSEMPKIAVKSKLRIEQDNEFLREAPEVSIFLACLGMVEELRHLERAFRQEKISDREFFDKFNEVLGQLSQLAEATERFDIVWPVVDYGSFSPFFWRWFNWWDDYLQGLTPRQLGQLERQARSRKASADQHRPSEHWIAHRGTPAFTLVIS